MDTVETRGNHTGAAHHKQRPALLARVILPAVVAVVAIALIVLSFLAYKSSIMNLIDSSKYQLVVLSNDATYFGKLEKLGNGYYKLDKVFYIEEVNNTENKEDQNLQLTKRGNEIQGPQDPMIINEEHVVMIENLKNDGKVAQAIQKYYESK